MKRARQLVCALALAAGLGGPGLGSAAPGCSAEEPRGDGGLLRAEFWMELEPVSEEGIPLPIGLDEGARRLLDEATWVFGGMVWGFSYEYEPYDRTRGIAERFKLASLGAIPRRDPRLVPFEARFDSSELRAYVEYRPSPAELSLMEGYSRGPWARAQGLGRADLLKGWPGRREAYEDALREAVRAHLRSIEPNKPRRSTGRVVFEAPPRIVVREGSYLVRARARIEVVELLPYVLY